IRYRMARRECSAYVAGRQHRRAANPSRLGSHIGLRARSVKRAASSTSRMRGLLGMGAERVLLAGLAAASLLAAAGHRAQAAEYTFSTYGLGGMAFGAGVTPPPGTYVSTAASFYRGRISGNIDIGGVVFNAGAKVELLAGALNGLYVPDWEVLGGHL